MVKLGESKTDGEVKEIKAESKLEKKDDEIWYKKWWGVLIVVFLILPFFLIWQVWAKTKWNNVAKVLVTLAIVGFYVLAFSGGGDSSSGNTSSNKTGASATATAAKTETTTPTPAPKSPSLGDEVVLNINSDPKTACDKIMVLGVDKSDADEIMKSTLANDNTGIAQLITQGQAFMVNNCTKAKYLDSALGYRKVRVLEGDTSGQAGWLPTEWIHGE